tara:strand:+ start:160 stop:561 length:402 start_codon:yes stop_codon:yes gene_type:complete
MTASSADDLLALKGKRRFGVAAVPEHQISYRIKSLSERERNEYEARLINPKTGAVKVDRLKLAKVSLIVLCVVDSDGNRVFTDSQTRDLLEIDSAITNSLHEQINDHVGFSDGDVDKLVKNSEATAGDDSVIG